MAAGMFEEEGFEEDGGGSEELDYEQEEEDDDLLQAQLEQQRAEDEEEDDLPLDSTTGRRVQSARHLMQKERREQREVAKWLSSGNTHVPRQQQK